MERESANKVQVMLTGELRSFWDVCSYGTLVNWDYGFYISLLEFG